MIVALDEVPPCCGRQVIGLGDGDVIGEGVGDGDRVGSAVGEAVGFGIAEDEEWPGEVEPHAASKTISAARVVAASRRIRTRLGPRRFGEQGRWSLLGRGRRLHSSLSHPRRDCGDGRGGLNWPKELSRGTFLFTLKCPVRLPVSSLSTFDLINVRYLPVYPTQSLGTQSA